MPGKERRRQLARERYQRQQRRRQHREERRRTIKAIATAVAVVVIVVGGVSFGAYKLSAQARGGETSQAQGSPSAGAPSASTSASSSAAAGTCAYTTTQGSTGGKDVGTPPTEPVKGIYEATVKTNRGTLTMELDGTKAPCTVNSFQYLAGKDFFDQTKCHRLTTKGIFVLQCGDPTGTGRGGPGYQFGTENTSGAAYLEGTLAMANSGSPDSNGSQFFIVYKDSTLPPSYTVFGHVTSGLDIVEKVAKAGVAGQGEKSGDGAPKLKVTIDDVAVHKKAA